MTEEFIHDFSKCTRYFANGGFSRLIAGLDKYDNNKDELGILSNIIGNDLSNMKFPTLLIFINKEVVMHHKVNISDKDSKNYENKESFLKKFKEILNLPYNIKDLLSSIEEKKYLRNNK